MYSLAPTFDPYALRGLGVTLSDLAAAITRMEGSCSAPGACVNNNPGNLTAYAANQPVDSRGIRIFPTYQAGYDALLAQERVNIGKGLTLDEFFGGKPGVYAGYANAAAGNNPTQYAGNVSSWLGIPRDVSLSSIFGGSNVPDLGGSTGADSGSLSPDWLGADANTPVWSQGWLSSADDGGISPLALGALGLAALGLLWAAAS